MGGILAFLSSEDLTVFDDTFYDNGAEFIDRFFYLFYNEAKIYFTPLWESMVINETINHTQSLGGCFYFLNCFNQSSTSIKRNKFKGNHADIGGVIFTHNFSFTLGFVTRFTTQNSSLNIFKKNKAFLYGDLVASTINDFRLYRNFSDPNINRETTRHINFLEFDTPILSGSLNYDCFFLLVGIDGNGHPALWDQSFEIERNLTLYPWHSSGEPQEIEFSFLEKKGFLCAYSVVDKIKKPFAKNLTLVFSTLNFTKVLSNSTFEVTLQFRNCSLGEKFDEILQNCVECSAGFFSFADNFSTPSTCSRCVNTPFFCYGGHNLTPKAGFWRYDDKSPNFLKCPNKRACLGDLTGIYDEMTASFDNKIPTGECAHGYKGVLCSECAEGFGRSDDYRCGSCQQRW